jgi:hypothetical protein
VHHLTAAGQPKFQARELDADRLTDRSAATSDQHGP